MSKTIVSTYLAIPMPLSFHDEFFRHKLYAMLDELCSLSNRLDFHLAQYGIHNPSIELFESAEDKNRLESWFDSEYLNRHVILRVEIEIPVFEKHPDIGEIPTSYWEEIKAKYVDDDRLLYKVFMPDDVLEQAVKTGVEAGVHSLLIREYFLVRVRNLVLAANLASPGSLELAQLVVVQNERVGTYRELMSAYVFRNAVELSNKIGWPPLQELNFKEVWNWLNMQEGFLLGFGGNSTNRALNAYTYLFDSRMELTPMQLMWALVGIEALYVKGKVALIEQVKEKSQVLLGQQEMFKKQVGKMYDLRSRFLHGDLDFPARYLLGHSDEEKFDEELGESVALAIAILTSTLQKMIQEGWDGLKFSYTVNGF